MHQMTIFHCRALAIDSVTVLSKSVFQFVVLLCPAFFGEAQGEVIEVECDADGIAVTYRKPLPERVFRCPYARKNEDSVSHYAVSGIASGQWKGVNGIEPTLRVAVAQSQKEFLPAALPWRTEFPVDAPVVVVG